MDLRKCDICRRTFSRDKESGIQLSAWVKGGEEALSEYCTIDICQECADQDEKAISFAEWAMKIHRKAERVLGPFTPAPGVEQHVAAHDEGCLVADTGICTCGFLARLSRGWRPSLFYPPYAKEVSRHQEIVRKIRMGEVKIS